MSNVLAQWDDWLGRATDRLMDLDGRSGSAVSDSVRLDLAAAFVCRKAIADRVGEVRAAPNEAARLSALPLHDAAGELVANDLAQAATLLDKVLDRVQQAIDRDEREQAAVLSSAARATTDLAAATALSEQLGQLGNRVAALREQLTTAGRDPQRLAAAADAIAAARTELEAMGAERTAMLARFTALAARVAELRAHEARVRELSARCREKVTPVPPLAVPSVDALAPAPAEADLAGLPWPAVRGKLAPVLDQVERLGAALAEAERRFSAPITERDDLRGLLQAFRDKAGARGIAERPEIDSAYSAARDVLWSAPCDLVSARSLVQAYTTAVNSALATVDSGGLR